MAPAANNLYWAEREMEKRENGYVKRERQIKNDNSKSLTHLTPVSWHNVVLRINFSGLLSALTAMETHRASDQGAWQLKGALLT